ncbi:uncharacterized protein BDW43DRAFT_282767, partial [Aspergillus alliaceus]
MADHEDQTPQGPGTLLVLDGLPIVEQNQRATLVKFLLRKLDSPGPTDARKVYMPLDTQQKTFGVAVIRVLDATHACDILARLNGIDIDRHHQMTVERIDTWDRYEQIESITDGFKQQLGLIFPVDLVTELYPAEGIVRTG